MNNTTNRISGRRYGITERKKRELDALTIQVLDAQLEVEKRQAIATSLNTKLTSFQDFLATADAKRTATLNNLNLAKQLVQSAYSLKENSENGLDEIVLADNKTEDLARKVKEVMDMLIFSAEVVNKLSNMVLRQKALNPLISDELVSRISKAGTDANKAVALHLVALQSSFAAHASNIECKEAALLEDTQAMALYRLLSGRKLDGQKDDNYHSSLYHLLDAAYSVAKGKYNQIQDDCNRIMKQLDDAQYSLKKAQSKFNSLSAGLAAANAAALSS